MSRLRRGPASGATVASYYGNTLRLSDPNDAFFVWNRWLGHDRYQAALPADPSVQASMRSFFDAWASVSPLPLLNKNNRNLAVVTDLARILPSAFFVIMRREALATVASLLQARRTVHGDIRQPWGVFAAAEHAGHDELGYIDDICTQAVAARRAATDAAHALGERRVCLVDYEQLADDPDALVETVASRTGIAPRRAPQATALRSPRQTLALTPEERTRAELVLAELEAI